MKKLHIDLETYSSVDIMRSGSYKYFESIDFEILIIAYAFDNEKIQVVELAKGEKIPTELLDALNDPTVQKYAHNANFERNALKAYSIEVPIEQWTCTAVKAAYSGLPMSLSDVGKALGLTDKAKLATGKALIRFFCCPIKRTNSRNFWTSDIVKWDAFVDYCVQDVAAERAIAHNLECYNLTDFEKQLYVLDQQINDRGIKVDLVLAKNATTLDLENKKVILDKIKSITGVDNPNSPAQLKNWIGTTLGKTIKSLAKTEIPNILDGLESGPVSEVLELRSRSSKSSIKKYKSMLEAAGSDFRVRGLLQIFGANRTGRWAGRLVQVQNLPRNYLVDLDDARELIKHSSFEVAIKKYSKLSSTLSQLIRTAFIPKDGFIFAVSDFSAIEARVIAWVAGEQWRIDVFNDHGMIYEASASMMFNLPFEQCKKEANNGIRMKGKIAELALGFGGSVGAMKNMGGEGMGLSDPEMKLIVDKWRRANKNIVGFWAEAEQKASKAVRTGKKQILKNGLISFNYDGKCLLIKLPSGRNLHYREPSFALNKWGREALQYKGLEQTTKQWVNIDTYGGKLVENIVQAIARDLLAYSMIKISPLFPIVMHVHDEVVCEVPIESCEKSLTYLCKIMSLDVPWAKGLPLNAEGYLTPYYKKD